MTAPHHVVAALRALGVTGRAEAQAVMQLWQRSAGWTPGQHVLWSRLAHLGVPGEQVAEVVAAFTADAAAAAAGPVVDERAGYGFTRDLRDPAPVPVRGDVDGVALSMPRGRHARIEPGEAA